MSHSINTIRKIGILVSIFFLFFSLAAPVRADEANPPGRYSFSLSPLMGMLHGQAEELVFEPIGGDRLLSELLWDLKPLVYLGLALDFSPRDPFRDSGFIAAASIKFGFPFRSGTHENRDWLNRQHGLLTHFSQHDVFVLNAILADISAGYSWRLNDSFAFRAFAEFSFMHFAWSGENGFVQYPPPNEPFPPWHSGLPKRNLYGMVIRYSQNWFIFAPGISLMWRFSPRFSLEGNFSYTPLIICNARDDHLRNAPPAGTVYWDFMSSGHYINGGGSFIFSPRDNMDFSLAVSYRHITGTRGKTYIQENNFGQISRSTLSDAGAGFSALDISLAARIRLTGHN